jgi:serine/threonine protein kinase
VYKGIGSQTRVPVALKKIVFPCEQQTENAEEKARLESEGLPLIVIREIKVLKRLRHQNIIELIDIAIEKNPPNKNKIYYVFPLMEHDLAGLIENYAFEFTHPVIKCLLKQMLEGLQYLHIVRFSFDFYILLTLYDCLFSLKWNLE